MLLLIFRNYQHAKYTFNLHNIKNPQTFFVEIQIINQQLINIENLLNIRTRLKY